MEFLLDLATGRYAQDDLIRWRGHLILAAIVFAETGLWWAASSQATPC